jgi:hypothetical protein
VDRFLHGEKAIELGCDLAFSDSIELQAIRAIVSRPALDSAVDPDCGARDRVSVGVAHSAGDRGGLRARNKKQDGNE